jgi:hypothetical protein
MPRTGAVAALVATLAFAGTPAWASPGGAAAGGKPDSKPTPAKPEQANTNGNSAGVVVTGTGIVQAISGRTVVVRQLDGSVVRVLVGPRTLVLVNGAKGTLADVRLGFVAKFTAAPRHAALVLRVTDPAGGRPVVKSVSENAVVVTAGGTTITVPVDDATRVLLNGNPVELSELEPGDVVLNGNWASAPKKPVNLLRLRRLV